MLQGVLGIVADVPSEKRPCCLQHEESPAARPKYPHRFHFRLIAGCCAQDVCGHGNRLQLS